VPCSMGCSSGSGSGIHKWSTADDVEADGVPGTGVVFMEYFTTGVVSSRDKNSLTVL